MNARKNGRDNGCVIVITCYNYYYFDYNCIVCAQKGRFACLYHTMVWLVLQDTDDERWRWK